MGKTADSGRDSKLPDEIIEAQKVRSDLLKWKLALIAALGAAGFGLMEKVSPAPLLLALIPLVSLYVDLLCSNLNLRQVVIGTYFRSARQDAYETFVHDHRRVFDLEDSALYWSTMTVCLLVAIVGAAFKRPEKFGIPAAMLGPNSAHAAAIGNVLITSGVLGLLVSVLALWMYHRKLKLLAPYGDMFSMLAVQNRALIPYLLCRYTPTGLATLRQFLDQKGAFIFHNLSNGLFPAVVSGLPVDASGYQYVWVRDNIHIAHAHLVCGDARTAARAAAALLAFFRKYAHRFEDIIGRRTDPSMVMNRPHIRFDGESLTELDQRWPHAQNDALGYFLWFYSKLAREGHVPCGPEELDVLALFPRYFQAIEYWRDADSGHWEEVRKVSASSIGAVVAGLREFEGLLDATGLRQDLNKRHPGLSPERISALQREGCKALEEILPCESVQPASHYRRYDSALLFLIYPLAVLEWERWGDQILDDVATHLQGEHGVRRYLGDSYWCADYADKLTPEIRTADFSESLQTRDALLRAGEEAQWCLFDPVISVIYGQRFLALTERNDHEHADRALSLQTHYFNRALSHLTAKGGALPEFAVPEAYYLRKGRYVPNDNTPLQWAQANLWLAVRQMQHSAEMVERQRLGGVSLRAVN